MDRSAPQKRNAKCPKLANAGGGFAALKLLPLLFAFPLLLAAQSDPAGQVIPRGTTLPSICEIGSFYNLYVSGEARLYICQSANNWQMRHIIKGTTLPETCSANFDLAVDTDATPSGQQFYICNSTGDGWVLIGDGSGGGGLPAGLIAISLTACPAGFSEVASLDAKFLLGTLAAAADVGTTGGSDTVTSVLDHTHAVNVTDGGHVHGELAPSSAGGGSLTLAIDNNASGSQAVGLDTAAATTGITATTDNPAGGVASIDNRPAFTKVIFCEKD